MYPSLAYVSEDDPELLNLLPPSPERWDCRHVSLYLVLLDARCGTQGLMHVSQAFYQLRSVHSPIEFYFYMYMDSFTSK